MQEVGSRLTFAALNLLISNAQLVAVQLAIRVVLAAAYELGRTRCFALLVLFTFSAWVVLAGFLAASGKSTQVFCKDESIAVGAIIGLSAILAWFWSRYIQRFQPNRRVFDDEVGAALVHYRSR